MDNTNNRVDYNHKVLEVSNLKKQFIHGTGKNKLIIPAVDGLTFDIYKREVFGLVGESGCGKTTTGRTLMKLYNPTEGVARLNGEIIGAGYKEYITEIKRVKKEAAEKILAYDEQKYKIVQINKKRDNEIEYTKTQINTLKQKKLSSILEAELPLKDYKTLVFKTKNFFAMDIERINYEYFIESTKVHELTTNLAEVDYKREISGAENNYKRKVDGLKESAALNQDTIETRIEETKVYLEASLERLEKKFLPLISENAKHIISKEEGKSRIHVLKESKKTKLSARKLQYKEEKLAFVIPNKSKIKNEVDKIKEDSKKSIQLLLNEISEIKETAKKAASSVPSTNGSGLSEEDKKIKVQEITDWKDNLVNELKEKIHFMKTSNKSKEALLASRKMQMIFQDPISSLNPRMTVLEIIGEGLTILGGYNKAEIKEKVGEVLELVGLSREYAARYPHEFSGGQRQRIGVARALIMNPDFIIADEPISSLDVSIRAQVINLLTELKDSLGLTMMFIAHDLSVVRFFCDRIAVMYNGKIVELASSEELFKNPMHAYTTSLLSSIPQPDPDYERNRKKIDYNPRSHEYRVDKPSMREIANEHYIYANDKEFKEIKKRYDAKNKKNVKAKDELK